MAAFLLVVVVAALLTGCTSDGQQRGEAKWTPFRVECETRNTSFFVVNEGGVVKSYYVAFFRCPGSRFNAVISPEMYDVLERGTCVELSGEVNETTGLKNLVWTFPCESNRPKPRAGEVA